MKSEPNELIRDYLTRLELAIKDLPYMKGKELMLDIEGHIYESLENSSAKDEVTVLNILERLGEPEDVVKEYIQQMEIDEKDHPAHSGNTGDELREQSVESYYNNGGIPPWVVIITVALVFPVGIILLWISRWWATKHKLIATLIPVVGVFLVLTMSFTLAIPAYRSTAQITEIRHGTDVGQIHRQIYTPGTIEFNRTTTTIGSAVGTASSLLQRIGGIIGVPIMFFAMLSSVFSPFLSAIYLAITKSPRPVT